MQCRSPLGRPAPLKCREASQARKREGRSAASRPLRAPSMPCSLGKAVPVALRTLTPLRYQSPAMGDAAYPVSGYFS